MKEMIVIVELMKRVIIAFLAACLAVAGVLCFVALVPDNKEYVILPRTDFL